MITALAVGTALAAAPGDLDAGFGFGGKVTTGITEYGDDRATAVALDFDGKLVAVGASGTSFTVARYSTDGTLDPTFGGDGTVTTSFGPGLEARANGVAVHADGAIVVVGSARPPFNLGGEGNGDFAVARYTENGDLDPSFGGDGRVTTEFGANEDAEDVAFQTDGAIVVAGTSDQFALARYEPDGDLDPTFSVDGKQTTSFGAGRFANGKGVAIQPNGAIVVAGFTTDASTQDTDFAAARYESDGDPDPTFSMDGQLTTDFGDGEASDVAIQGGAIVLAGRSNGDFALARYEADGDPDPTFSMDGLLTTDLGGSDGAEGVAIAPGGTIVAAGTSETAGGELFAVARYEADGDPDPTFSTDGQLTTDLGAGTSDTARGLAVQSGGQIVVAGISRIRSGSPPGFVREGPGDFVVARYEPDGDLDPAFGGDGKVDTQVAGGFGDRANAVAVQGDGKIVVAGFGIDEPGADDEDFAVARYEPDGDPDTGFSGDGKLTTDFGADSVDVANAVAVQADGAVVVAGVSDGDFAVARYEPDGDPDPTFSTDGELTTDFGPGHDEARGIAIQANGAIVVAGGSDGGGLALARYQPGGAPDTTFSTDGRLTDAFFEAFAAGQGVAVQSDGAIVATGGAPVFGLARYEPDGDPDNGFGGDGKVTTDFGADNDFANDVAIQPGGAIVAAGAARVPDTPVADCGGEPQMDFALARYEPDGDPDAGFSGDGALTTDFGGTSDRGHGVVLQSDGAIVAAGHAGSDFALARYEPDGDLDAGFSGDGKLTTDFGGSCDVARKAALSSGALLLAGFAQDPQNSRFALARHLGSVPAEPTVTGPPAAPSAPAPPAGAAPPDTSVQLELTARRAQRALRQRGIVLFVECPAESCVARASGVVDVPSATKASAAKRFTLAGVRKSLVRGQRAKLTLRFSKSLLVRVRRALRARKRVTARITVAVTDPAGNRRSRTIGVRLVR